LMRQAALIALRSVIQKQQNKSTQNALSYPKSTGEGLKIQRKMGRAAFEEAREEMKHHEHRKASKIGNALSRA
jgi:hypothetical protein